MKKASRAIALPTDMICTLNGDIENGQRVMAAYRDHPFGASGTYADVDFSETWLTISSDSCDGTAMIHLDALPLLIEALNNIHDVLIRGEPADDPTGGDNGIEKTA